LSYDNQSNHERYQEVVNNIPASPPPAQEFAMVANRMDYLKNFSSGKEISAKDFIFLSLFDEGEGFIDTLYPSSYPRNIQVAAPGLIQAGDAVLRFSLIRNSWSNFSYALDVSLNILKILGAQITLYTPLKLQTVFT